MGRRPRVTLNRTAGLFGLFPEDDDPAAVRAESNRLRMHRARREGRNKLARQARRRNRQRPR